MNVELPDMQYLVSAGVVKLGVSAPTTRYRGETKTTAGRRAYLKRWWAENYVPTGRPRGRPSVTGLSMKALGSYAAYQRALYKLRRGAT